MRFTSNLHNMKNLDNSIEDMNKNIKKVFFTEVTPELQ